MVVMMTMMIMICDMDFRTLTWRICSTVTAERITNIGRVLVER